MRFWYKISQFMMGRYGIDQLFYVLFGVAVAVSVINLFTRLVVLQFIVYAIIAYAFFRAFSRNIYARRAENMRIEKLFRSFNCKRDFMKQKRADKTHVYKKCPGCKAVLRLPRRPGRHTTVCPKCGKSFNVHVYK